MSVETNVDSYRVTVEPGVPENFIVIQPPLGRRKIEDLVDEGVLSETTAERSWSTLGEDGKTYIPWGRLILGNQATDESSERFAEELRQQLNSYTVGE